MTKSSLPKSWRLVKLGEVAVRVMEKYEASPSSPEPWVGADHLDEGDLRIKRWSMSDDPVFPPTFRFKFPIGAVLIHSRNPKKVAVAEFSAITGEKIFALSSRDESIFSSQFLAFVLQSTGFGDFTNEWMTGSVNKFLNWSALEKFEFALPPISEQRRIVEAMEVSDDCVESISTARMKLGNLSKAWAADAFSAVGMKSEMKSLDEVAEVVMGRQLSPSKRLGNRPLRYLRAANVSPHGIDLTDVLEMDFTVQEENSFKSRIDDVLLVEGGNEKSVGCPALVTDASEELCIQNTLVRCRTKNKETLNPEFMYHLLKFNFDGGTFAKMCAGTTIMHLGQKRLAKLLVPVPSLHEQRWIAKNLNQFDKTKSLLDIQLSSVSVLRKVLLESLMAGSYSNV